jgi:hypothetical protein
MKQLANGKHMKNNRFLRTLKFKMPQQVPTLERSISPLTCVQLEKPRNLSKSTQRVVENKVDTRSI